MNIVIDETCRIPMIELVKVFAKHGYTMAPASGGNIAVVPAPERDAPEPPARDQRG